MSEWSQDNILVLAGTAKKGGGVNAVLSLLQDLIAFQDKVGSTIDAQDLGENKQKLEEFQTRLGEMYESLLDMARGGVRSIRQEPKVGDENPIMMNDNTIQQIP
jgi:hypothetical protein